MIEIIYGDITNAKTDAIVNAANPKMLGGGGVDGAIHTAAGPRLLQACREIKSVDGIRCPFGQSRITPAGNLTARFVIHTVGPIYRNESNPAAILTSAYTSALELALTHNCSSIAFPAISCGAYGYPREDAARIALGVCGDPRYTKLRISFYILERNLLHIFQQALEHL